MTNSFRDPAGSVFIIGERVIRLVKDPAIEDFVSFLDSRTFRDFLDRGQVVPTSVLTPGQAREFAEITESHMLVSHLDAALIAEHPRIPFPSYPYEWPPEMLYQAALLTLDLAERSLDDGFGLKDATPYNILFNSHRAVMVDVLSFERRDPHDAVWLPYAQFVRTFVLPLLVNKHFRLLLANVFVNQRDCLEPQDVYRLCNPIQKLLPPFLGLVTIPTWLTRRSSAHHDQIYRKRSYRNQEQARFVVRRLIAALRRTLRKVAPEEGRRSEWSDYMQGTTQSQRYVAAKRTLVENALAHCRPQRVLSIGCNTGYFSALAAKAGGSVVAIDRDEVVVGRVSRKARGEDLEILPLVVDFTRPTPAIGWRNQECASFLDRARETFDLVMMLAVVHHMLVSERVPLREIIGLAAELSKEFLLIEFVPPEDEMFRQIAHGRDALFRYLTREFFEATVGEYFELVLRSPLEGTARWLYLLRKRGNPLGC